jgi:outer membrane protein assembly factor BamD (BamD/ComL family)
MSLSGISSSNFSEFNTQTAQSNRQQFQQDFQQLGQDLQSGNLSAAQTDFATIQQIAPQNQAAASSSAQGNSPVAQEFSQLSQDLQSGNISAAQQAYTTIQQDFQNQQTGQTQPHHHHHHGGSGSGAGASASGASGSSTSEGSAISQLFSQLGTDLQTGNLATAQQTYATLQQDFQQYAAGGASSTPGSSQPTSTGVSVNA